MNNSAPLALLDESQIKDLIYEVRGQKVMLDFDLARIYGYETRYFNRQVKNNADRFDNDFTFQLTREEWAEILKCKNFTSNWGGNRKLPFAFTEQGIYMLMTVLRGDLATRQSKTLIRLFKSIKDYMVEANSLGSTNEILALVNQVRTNTEAIVEIKGQLSVVMDNFIDPSTYKSFLIMDGEKIESDVAYRRIYSMDKKSVFSDNKAKSSLTQSFIADFIADRPDLHIEFKKTKGRFHDRYIVLDYPGKVRVFHCGASSKDGGNKITTIMEAENPEALPP